MEAEKFGDSKREGGKEIPFCVRMCVWFDWQDF